MDALANKMASDILLLDLSEITLIADYFVIATADTERQMASLVDHVKEQVREQGGLAPVAIEGAFASGWVLIDFGSIVVHLFSEAQRQHYQLEELWRQGKTVVRIA